MSQLEEIQEALKGLDESELAEVSDFIAELAGDQEEEDEDDDEENDVEIDEDGEDEGEDEEDD